LLAVQADKLREQCGRGNSLPLSRWFIHSFLAGGCASPFRSIQPRRLSRLGTWSTLSRRLCGFQTLAHDHVSVSTQARQQSCRHAPLSRLSIACIPDVQSHTMSAFGLFDTLTQCIEQSDAANPHPRLQFLRFELS
jgi:hypothetical protein